jgi:phosphoribosylanthranilate isomerase
MSLWVKVCANTSLADAMVAAEAGADAVGFVFAASPRRVTVEQVKVITPGLPGAVEKIGVFVDSGFGEIETAVRECGLTGVQLHSEAGEDFAGLLRERFGAGLRILQVLHYGMGAAEKAGVLAGNKSIDGILIDSRTALAVGGTGVRFDWEAAESLFREGGARLVAAGGLTPENVGEAIGKLRPWGVDVASGVEASPGRKDPEKVRAFVENARRAQGSGD